MMNPPESSGSRADYYEQQSLKLAQKVSHLWSLLPSDEKDPLYALDPELDLIRSYNQGKGGQTGVQKWYEFKLEEIKTSCGENADARSRMTFRLWEDLSRIAKSIDTYLESSKATTLNKTAEALRTEIKSLLLP